MFTLSLVTPEKKLLTDVEVDEVIVPAQRGELDILPGHVPLVSTLRSGVLKIREKGADNFKTASISWGYMEVNPEGVIILADTAEWPEEIDKDKAEKQLAKAEERLQQAGLTPDEQAMELRKMDREKARIEVSGQNKIH